MAKGAEESSVVPGLAKEPRNAGSVSKGLVSASRQEVLFRVTEWQRG